MNRRSRQRAVHGIIINNTYVSTLHLCIQCIIEQSRLYICTCTCSEIFAQNTTFEMHFFLRFGKIKRQIASWILKSHLSAFRLRTSGKIRLSARTPLHILHMQQRKWACIYTYITNRYDYLGINMSYIILIFSGTKSFQNKFLKNYEFHDFDLDNCLKMKIDRIESD